MKKHVVILGASIAGINVMNTLVKNNFEGQITLIDQKDTFPYNPYKLSKDWMKDLDKMTPPLLKKEAYYQNHQIDLRLNTIVKSFNPKDKTVFTNKGEVTYDILVIALGSKLNKLDESAKNLYYLRTFDDALTIKEKVKTSKHITIIGGGFISLELASSFRQLDKEVAVVMREALPLLKPMGETFATYIKKLHDDHSVTFYPSTNIKSWIKENGTITKVVSDQEDTIETDLVIAAIGVKPNLVLKNESLKENGAILVDEYHRTSIPNVYAAGDITLFPYRGKHIHVDHWEVAYSSGINIAKNILSENQTPYDFIPYFWTDEYDETFEYLGYAKDYTKTYLRQYDDKKFVIAYTDDQNHLLAILFANHAEKRKDVENYLRENIILNPKSFTDTNQKLL